MKNKESIFKNSPFGYALHKIILDEKGKPVDYKFLEVNKTFEKLTGLKQADIIGKNVTEAIPGIEKDKFDWIAFYGKIVLEQKEETFEQYSEQLGTHYKVQVYAPQKEYFVTIFTDITAEKSIAQIAAKLNTFDSENIDLQYIADKARELSGAKYAVLNKFDENGHDFSTIAISGVNKHFEKAVSILGFDIVGKKWEYDAERQKIIDKQKTTVFQKLTDLTRSVVSEKTINLLCKTFNIGEAALVKITRNNIMLADFTLFFEREKHLENKEIVETFADLTGMLLSRIDDRKKAEQQLRASNQQLEANNQQLTATEQQLIASNQQLEANNQQLTATEQQLRALNQQFIAKNRELKESEARFKALYNASFGGIAIHDRSVIQDCNKGLSEMTGYKEDELIGMDGLLLIAEESRQMVKEHILSGYEKPYEAIGIRKNGEKYPLQILGKQIPYKGKNVRVTEFRDITELKKAEEALKESEEKYKSIFENNLAPMFLIDPDTGKLIDVNDAAVNYYGWSRDELRQMNINQINTLSPEEIKREMEKARNAKRYYFEFKHKRADGSIRDVEVFSSKIVIGGKDYLHSIIHDITEKKKAELQIKRYSRLFENSLNEIYIFNTENLQFIEAKKAAQKNIGYSLNELNQLAPLDLKPELTREQFQQLINPLLQGKKNRVVFETIHRRKDKTTYPVEVRLELMRFDDKEFFVAFINDITKRKKAEQQLIALNQQLEANNQQLTATEQQLIALNQQLEANNQQLIAKNEELLKLSTAIKQSPSVIAITDTKGNLEFVNPKYTEITGYTFDEVVNKNPSILKSGYNTKEKYKNLWKTISSGKEWRGEFQNKKKNGELYWERASISPIFDEHGKIINYIKVAEDITKHKLSIQALKENEEKFRTLFNQVSDAVFMYDPETFKLIEANEATSRIYGYSSEELKGMSVLEFSAEVEKSKSAGKTINQKGEIKVDIRRHKKKDGTDLYVELQEYKMMINNKPIAFDVCHDITERLKYEKEKLKLSHAVEQSPVSVIITDLDGNIEYANPKTLEITGYTKKELIGKNPRIFNSGEKPKSEYEKLWETISSGKEWNGEFHNKKKNGELYWESASISPIFNEKQEIINYVAVKEDITERKMFIADLEIAKEKAEESDRLKSAFLANMSHEIRTPMNGILGFAELLKEPNLTGEQQRDYIKIIEKSGKRMLDTINDIVDISKIEAGLVEVVNSEVSINDVLKEQYAFFNPEAQQKGLELVYQPTLSDEEATVITDKHKLEGILTNLIKNAIKYTNSGTIKVGCRLKGNNIELYVNDTGIGIPAHRQEAIFNRFEQADIEDTRVFEGSGLGLAIAKSYVEMLGGKIWVESEEGLGSTFYFTLPASSNLEEKSGNAISAQSEKTEPKVKGLKILIAEDDELSRKYISLIVKDISAEILEAETGIKVLELCRQHKDIDLILMDIQMPGINGYEATRQIREFNKDVIIIAQTAFALSGDREKAIEAGCNDYISKPIKKADLLEKIQKYT